jgi:hypothetical protein
MNTLKHDYAYIKSINSSNVDEFNIELIKYKKIIDSDGYYFFQMKCDDDEESKYYFSLDCIDIAKIILCRSINKPFYITLNKSFKEYLGQILKSIVDIVKINSFDDVYYNMKINYFRNNNTNKIYFPNILMIDDNNVTKNSMDTQKSLNMTECNNHVHLSIDNLKILLKRYNCKYIFSLDSVVNYNSRTDKSKKCIALNITLKKIIMSKENYDNFVIVTTSNINKQINDYMKHHENSIIINKPFPKKKEITDELMKILKI